LVTTALPTALASGARANHCAFPVYLWSVGGSVGPKQTIPAGGSYSEALHHALPTALASGARAATEAITAVEKCIFIGRWSWFEMATLS
jgi:hypothetical protein